MIPVKVDIVSDIACPWCAIGYARLEQAMQAPGDDFLFEIEWHACELNPDPSSPSLPVKEHDRQTAMKQALFHAYFGRAQNIANPEILVSCASAAGLAGDDARRGLESDDFTDSVRDDESRYQRAGVSAVPAFIINDKHLISGAQDCATRVDAVRRISAEPEPPNP